MNRLVKTSEQIITNIKRKINAHSLSQAADFRNSEIQKIETPLVEVRDPPGGFTGKGSYNPLIRHLMEKMTHFQFNQCHKAEILPIYECNKDDDKYMKTIGYGVTGVNAARAIEIIVSILGKLDIPYSITIKLDPTHSKNWGGELVIEKLI